MASRSDSNLSGNALPHWLRFAPTPEFRKDGTFFAAAPQQRRFRRNRGALGSLLTLLCVGWVASAAAADDSQADDSAEVSDDVLFSLGSPIGPIEYRPARGLRVGWTGLNIGGFKTYEFEKEEGDDWFFAIDSINFLVLFQPIHRLRLFMELEVGGLYEADLSTGESESDPFANFQRLYGEISVFDSLNLRGGKFLTPVGDWNLVPAEPFTPTAIEPALLEAFDEHQTGAMIHGSFFPEAGMLRYWLWGQANDFDTEEDEDSTDHGVGGRVEYSGRYDKWSIGSSFLAAEQSDEWGYVGGLDARLRCGRFEFASEFVYTWGNRENPISWGAFLQGKAEVLPNFFLIGRYEHSAPSEGLRNLEIGDVGLLWTPVPYLNFKATYRFTDRQSEEFPEGFKAAFSVVF